MGQGERSRRLTGADLSPMTGAGSTGARMIITQTPLHISIGGGGTDLPWYYERHGGLVISAAINRYVYIALNRTFRPDYFIKYSEIGRGEQPRQISNPNIDDGLPRHQ